MTYDFDAGLPSDFTAFIDPHSLFTVDATGGHLNVFKDADGITENAFIAAGIVSNFTLTGDFIVTVDFTIIDLPFANTARGLNESVLSLNSASELFEVLSFTTASEQKIEAYETAIGPIGPQSGGTTTGTYELDRTGNTLTAKINGSTIGTATYSASDPLRVELFGAQGLDQLGQPRSTTALDIQFDNLVVTAADIQQPTTMAEPGTLGLIGLGLAAIGTARRRRKS